MTKKRAKRKIESRLLDDLQDHPRQAGLFSNMSETELDELVENIRRNGVTNLVEISPDGTIIAGHQRVRAAKKLGWTKIKCWVRDDLAEAGDAAIEERLIADNLTRRQLGQLDVARCYKRLKQLEQGRARNGDGLTGDVRDRLEARFGISGRTLDRWARILDTPMEVQQAVQAKRLKLVPASKVAGLPKRNQKRIAERIGRGDDPNAVVKEYLDRNGEADSLSPWWFFQCLLRSLKENEDRLSPCLKSLDMILVKEPDLTVLKDGKKLLARLIRKVAEEFERRQQEQEKLQKARDEAWAAFTEES